MRCWLCCGGVPGVEVVHALGFCDGEVDESSSVCGAIFAVPEILRELKRLSSSVWSHVDGGSEGVGAEHDDVVDKQSIAARNKIRTG